MSCKMEVVAYIVRPSDYADKGRVLSAEYCAPTVCSHWGKDSFEGLVMIYG